ncbi:MAG: NUDIX domain-containing protein [Clostridia bacterium]|nr:NUDIX domain-containing protein [Clostridia bacterium]
MAEQICFEQKDYIFSYRAGALLWRDGKILMQKNMDKEGFTLPGGQVCFGEYTTQTLARALREETGAAIQIGRLAMVAEVFFQWKKPCHQINLYYIAELKNPDALPKEDFFAYDSLGQVQSEKEFCWIGADQLKKLKVYPSCIKPYLQNLPNEIVHLQPKDLED